METICSCSDLFSCAQILLLARQDAQVAETPWAGSSNTAKFFGVNSHHLLWLSSQDRKLQTITIKKGHCLSRSQKNASCAHLYQPNDRDTHLATSMSGTTKNASFSSVGDGSHPSKYPEKLVSD